MTQTNQGNAMPHAPQSHNDRPLQPYDPKVDNPFDDVEVLPGLGIAVLWVVLALLFVNLLLLPVHP
jgi:hypothetical protein